MIEQLPPAELHALRLDAKRLRYAAELLVPLWPSHHARRYLRRLMALQEALGLANDAEVARGLVRGLRITGWTLGVAEGFALAGAAGSRDMALEAWAGWRAAKRFWQDG
jgi:CHAD domain-containing protein